MQSRSATPERGTETAPEKPAEGAGERAVAGSLPANLLWSRLASSGGAVQRKLTVNAPGDRYERQADRVADEVLRMPEPATGGEPPAIQRMCAECEEEQVQRQLPDEEADELAAKERPGEVPRVAPRTEARVGALKGGGQPLSPPLLGYFEPRFGRDLSAVRVHAGPDAAEAAQELGARAFTVGRHVAFGSGEFRPETAEGRRLLAHELVHTVQQHEERRRVQRYATCESAYECPGRVSGEIGRARHQPMFVGGVSGSVQGLLVANFAVNSSALKPDLASNSAWAHYWGQMVTNPHISWEILGFSDCSGAEGVNEILRWTRAIAVNNMLPLIARSRVDLFAAAPLSDCIASNADERGRMLNRSVLIRQKRVTYTFPPVTVTANPYVACYDGTSVYVRKGGASHRCAAITSGGAPTPNGRYCIRRQGEAQRSNFFRDRSDWYLLEPQFPTSRFRMHLHPGSISEGCVTVTDDDCFERLAAVLNRSGTVTGRGHDGYPPGNTAGEDGAEVRNPERSVDCVGWLLVDRGGAGCAFMSISSGGGSSW